MEGTGNTRVRSEEAEWLSKNRLDLEERYPGKWVAVKGSKLISVGDSLSEVMDASRAVGVDHPLVTGIPLKEYQGRILVRSPRIVRRDAGS